MKSLTDQEIDLLLEPLQSLKGARLQKILYSGKHSFAMEFYHGGKLHHWIVDLKPARPLAFLGGGRAPFKNVKRPVPLQLFLRAHFVGKHLLEVQRQRDLGRVIQLRFVDGGIWQIHLYPHGQNFFAQSGDKSMWLHKPKETQPGVFRSERPPRSPEEIIASWWSEKTPGPLREPQKDEAAAQKEWVRRRKRLIENLTSELESLELGVWQAAGEALKLGETLSLPEKVQRALKDLPSRSAQMEFCFSREKKLKNKKVQLAERLGTLQEELKNPPAKTEPLPEPQKPKGVEKLRFKTYHHGPWTLWVGKSGSDNLSLLRTAKPWYLWLHVRDQAGAHGIVRRNRSEQLPARELRAMAEQFLKLSLPPGMQKRQRGSRVELIVAEVRHVRPIKGDRHGRVHYSKSSTLTVTLP